MSAKFTPGPWVHFNKPDLRGTVFNGIETLKGDPIVHWSGFDAAAFPSSTATANARLIAASPELLASAEKLLPLLHKFIPGYADDCWVAMAEMRNAIDRAKS